MEDAAVEEAEFAPPPVAAHPFLHSVSVAMPPPARRLDESRPLRQFTAEEGEARSSSSSRNAPMPEAPPEEPAPAPTQAAKKKTKKLKIPRSLLEPLMTIEKWERLPLLHEAWLKDLASLIPNGEQFLADRGFSLETYRELNSMDIVVKAQADMVAEIQEKGYVEVEVTDEEEEEEEEGRVHIGRRRMRLRPGVCKKPDGTISRLR